VDATTNAALTRIRIANANRQLKVGVFAEARIALAEHANALVVPPPALVRDANGTAVYVVMNDLAQRTDVQVGLEKPDAFEILSGVKEGDTVLTSSVYGLGEKAKLAKPEPEKPAKEEEKPAKDDKVKDEKPEKPR